MASVTIDGLAAAIQNELTHYSQAATDAIKVATQAIAQDCKQDIVNSSPSLTGSYRKGWRTTVAFSSRYGLRMTVSNKTDYQLTHLLEHGHITRSGKRKAGQPHIRPAEQRAIKLLKQGIREAVKNANG